MKKVSDIKLKDCMTADELVRQMYESGGFTAKKLGVGVNILENMVKDEDCKVFLSFPACIISTGTRGVIRDLIKNKLVDAVITTCGTLDHDLARVWKDYYHGNFLMDDKKLHKKGVNRLGNVLIPNECYGLILEEKMQPVISEIYNEGKKEFSTKDIIWEFGKRIDNEDSIIHWAYKNQIPIYVPGITDGAFGSQLWMFWQEHKDFKINLFEDEQELMNMVFDAKKSGALMIGGGISKHHVIWWNQFRDGLDYVVYITTAPEYDGSLSGAPVREAVSWGKVKEDAKFVTIEGDATIILPLMAAALLERLNL
jgi:deoxyhypusine synthase